MLKNIPLWWFILLAWLLAMFGGDFWQFNVMELFATFAILFTAGIAIYKWRKGKRRQDALISFPNNWSVNYDKEKGIVHFQASANVLVPHHAYGFDSVIFAGQKRIHPQNLGLATPIGKEEEGRKNFWGEIPLSQIPKGVSELQIQIKVRLDGDIKKVSEKRRVPITGLDLSEFDK